jgi:hypothetical protein
LILASKSRRSQFKIGAKAILYRIPYHVNFALIKTKANSQVVMITFAKKKAAILLSYNYSLILILEAS